MKNSKAILKTPGTMTIMAADIPVPKENEVLIKVEYVGICGSDVHGFESGPFIPPKDPNQEIGLGHECAGKVIAVGKRVSKFKPGDRVNIEPGVPCGHCRYCLEGKYNICPDVDFMATQPNYRGALTHYLCHPESFTYKLPDNMDTMEGALVEPAAVGMHAAMLADVKPGKKIVILGAGCIGLMTLQACKCLGATNIAVVDVLENGWQWLNDWERQPLSMGRKKILSRAASSSPTIWAPILCLKPPVPPSQLSKRRIWSCAAGRS